MEEENRENYLVAAINGIVSIDALYYQNGLPSPTKITLRRGKEISRTEEYSNQFVYRHPMCAGMVIYHV